MAPIISSVGCGTTNVHRSRSGVSPNTGVKVIMGVLASAATCVICKAEGTVLEPISASTRSSATSLGAFFAALVGSEASSRMTYFTGSPASVFGSNEKVLRRCTPSDDPGPVEPMDTPMVTSPKAGHASAVDASAAAKLNILIMKPSPVPHGLDS